MNSYLTPDFSKVSTYLFLLLIIALCVAINYFSYKILNSIPAKWLCDYNEEPGEDLLGLRYNFKQSGIYTSALFTILILLSFTVVGYSFYFAFIFFISFISLLITLGDGKYTIIPDQFTIALAVLCVGFAIFDLYNYQIFINSWLDILIGALCGGGALFLINLLSVLIFKKQGMGFGDVKLMLAFGTCLGFPYVFSAFMIAVITACLYIVFLLIKKIITKKEVSTYFPFGPFLCVGSVGTLAFVNQINFLINMYLDLFIIKP